VGLIVVLVSPARDRVRTIRGDVEQARTDGREIDRLHDTIEKDGGADRIKACGQPVTLVGNQSAVAWETGLNVGNVGYRPGKEISKDHPIVVLKPHHGGWQVRLYNLRPERQASCASLRLDSDFDF
jgi:hypothetical protein